MSTPLDRRAITLLPGLYHIEGVPVFLPETKAEVHQANAADLQKLIAKSSGQVRATDELGDERAADADFKAQVEGSLNEVRQQSQAQNIVLSNITDALKTLNERLDGLAKPAADDAAKADPATLPADDAKGGKGAKTK